MYVKYDLENYPLKIKTDSALGSYDKLDVYFKSSQNGDAAAGGIGISFNPEKAK